MSVACRLSRPLYECQRHLLSAIAEDATGRVHNVIDHTIGGLAGATAREGTPQQGMHPVHVVSPLTQTWLVAEVQGLATTL